MGKILAIIAAIVVLGGGAYLVLTMMNGNTEAPENQNEPTVEGEVVTENDDVEKVEPFEGTGSFMALLARGQSLKCDFTHTDEESGYTTSGTSYIDGENLRGDFEMTDGETTTETSVIRDGEYSYTWGQTPFGDSMALKHKLTAQEKLEEDVMEQKQEEGFDLEEELDYRCVAWRADKSMFVPPSDIEFTDFTEGMMQHNRDLEMLDGVNKEQMCAACDQVPPEAQAQCRASLGC